MSDRMADFTGLYPLSQTLQFELRPVGDTEKNLEKSGLLEQDRRRAEDYPKVKDFLDEKHKQFLQRALSGIELEWQPLAETIAEFQKDRTLRKKLETEQGEYRKEIIRRIKKNEEYGQLTESTPSKLFRHEIEQNPEILAEVITFGRFACYFKGYQENRANIYSAEAQQTSAAYRAVNDNFTKFATSVKIFDSRIARRDDLMQEIMAHPDLKGQDITDVFKVTSYNRYLPQSGIDSFNRTVSAVNYVINQHRQKHPEIPPREMPFLPPLFKQILSDRERAFTVREFEDGTAVCAALGEFIRRNEDIEIHGERVDLFSSLSALFAALNRDDDLFISAAELDKVSMRTLGRWDALRDLMGAYADQTIRTKGERSKYCNQDAFHFGELNKWMDMRTQETEAGAADWLDFWKGDKVSGLFADERNLRSEVICIAEKADPALNEKQDDVNTVKQYLDTIQELLHTLKPLAVSAEYGGDLDLQGIIQEHYKALTDVIPLYNCIRNFMTRKASETGKMKLMFDNPTLADGWDSNKEKDNTAVLFIRDGAYYLGIMNPRRKTDFAKLARQGSGPYYKKMVHKQIADASKDLPNLMRIDGKVVRKTGRKDEQGNNKILEDLKNKYLPPEINRIRKNGTYLATSEDFSKEDLSRYIEFYSEMISEYKEDANFSFRPSSDYKTWGDFTDDVKFQGYKVTFADISAETVDKLVEEGKLFLFQIWNKDFAPGAHGTPNKFTLYWKALFDPHNLADVVFKLNGEAELFYREPPIKNPVRHGKGEKLINRTIVTAIRDGKAERTPINEKVYREIFFHVNNRPVTLSEEASELLKKRLDWKPGMDFEETLGRLVVKEAKFELIKDRRFTERKFLFHVPITINFKANEKGRINEKVREFLRAAPDVKIIGIDRGERNLIYLVLMDQQGRILEQRSFNIVGGVDYQKKLDNREKERDEARKSWSEIGRIKDLKAGYLSGVIHEIAKMMVRHKAIVVMEDLNTGFKDSRKKIEKQVYQKFEQALIVKLNYLVFKDAEDTNVPGGVLNGYQLANPFESFKKLGRQSGFIFYVPAWCTSKIDPETGFVDFFGSRFLRYESAAGTKDFFSRFTSIRYNAGENLFEFAFDYKKFTDKCEGSRTTWCVCSSRDRLERVKDDSNRWSVRRVQLSDEMKELFERAGIRLEGELLPQILAIPGSKTDFWRGLLRLFRLMMQMRNSRPNSTSPEDDYIISPVRGGKGTFFDTRHASPGQPGDADANGAFNIARKGLWLLERIRQDLNDKMTQKDWLQFIQQS